MKSLLLAFSLFIALSPISFAAEPTAEVKLDLVAEGAMRKLGGYMPQQLKLSADKPQTLKKSPDQTSPLYGTIEFAGANPLIILD
jgi:hypothetical protein